MSEDFLGEHGVGEHRVGEQGVDEHGVGEQGQVQQLVARLERLERRDRRLKQAALACLLIFTCIGLMGQTTTTTPKKKVKPTAAAPPPPPPAPAGPTVVEAQGFILKDDNGRVRAELSMTGTGPSLKLRDQSGAALVSISLNDGQPGGPFVLLSDGQHHASINMSVLDGGGSQLALIGDRPDIQMHLGVTSSGTSFEATDKDGFGTTIGNTHREHRADGKEWKDQEHLGGFRGAIRQRAEDAVVDALEAASK
jgi:hypothetical protein